MIRRERLVLRGRPIYGAEPTSFGGAVQSLATIEPRGEKDRLWVSAGFTALGPDWPRSTLNWMAPIL